jgi:hypothetical protein
MEDQVRELLREIAEDIPPYSEVPPTLRSRARHRFALTVTSSAVLIAALLVGAILGLRTLDTTRARPATQPSTGPATATPASTSTPLETSGPGLLKPGTYRLIQRESLLPITFKVPAGWEGASDVGVLRRSSDSPRHMGLTFWLIQTVDIDPCHSERGVVRPGPTVDDLATALADQRDRRATTPTDVTFDGFAGKRLALTVPTRITFSDCTGGTFNSWTTPGGAERYQQGPGQVDELWILDVNRIRLVVDATFMPKTAARDRAELQRIVNSVRIG